MPEATVRRVLRGRFPLKKKKKIKNLPTVFFSLGSCGSFNTCEVLEISLVTPTLSLSSGGASKLPSDCFSASRRH